MSVSGRPTIGLFGDSIASGLGVRGESYGRLVARSLDMQLVDFSESAMTVDASMEALTNFSGRLDVAVIAHGVTEAILRPSPVALRAVPPRWRKAGWMDPRPYYSSRFFRRVVQRTESAVRWRVKRLLLTTYSPVQFVSYEDYLHQLTALVSTLTQTGTRVFIVGPVGIDARYFPGSHSELDRYSDGARKIHSNFIDIHQALDKWDDYLDDNFHPNASGHHKIADRIVSFIGGIETGRGSLILDELEK